MHSSFGNLWGSEQSAEQTRQFIRSGDTETKQKKKADSSYLRLGAIHQVSKSATYHYSC